MAFMTAYEPCHISNEMESGINIRYFVHLSKAFDTLSFDILLEKLNY